MTPSNKVDIIVTCRRNNIDRNIYHGAPITYEKIYQRGVFDSPEVHSRHRELTLVIARRANINLGLDEEPEEDELLCMLMGLVQLFSAKGLDLSEESRRAVTQAQKKYAHMMYR